MVYASSTSFPCFENSNKKSAVFGANVSRDGKSNVANYNTVLTNGSSLNQV